MASAVAPWALKRAEAIGSRRFDGVGQPLRGGVASLDFGRRGHRLGAHSGAVAAHCAAVEARDGTVVQPVGPAGALLKSYDAASLRLNRAGRGILRSVQA